jgi:hypothetical protein
MRDIRPIPTRYKGCHFRSRLEARWAVLLDALGARWEYETEGYETPYGLYLPDFIVHCPVRAVSEDPFKDGARYDYNYGERFFLEVKGKTEVSDLEWQKLIAVRDLTDTPVFIAAGSIPDKGRGFDFRDFFLRRPETFERFGAGFRNYMFMQMGDGKIGLWNHFHYARHRKVYNAFDAARSARFEHGESGAT